MTGMPSVGKVHKDSLKSIPIGSKPSEASPVDRKHQKHPLMDQKSS